MTTITLKVDAAKVEAHVKRVCRRNLKARGGAGCKCCGACPFRDAVLATLARLDAAKGGAS